MWQLDPEPKAYRWLVKWDYWRANHRLLCKWIYVLMLIEPRSCGMEWRSGIVPPSTYVLSRQHYICEWTNQRWAVLICSLWVIVVIGSHKSNVSCLITLNESLEVRRGSLDGKMFFGLSAHGRKYNLDKSYTFPWAFSKLWQGFGRFGFYGNWNRYNIFL